MPRCTKCKQMYSGAFHVNCPAVVKMAPQPIPPPDAPAAPSPQGEVSTPRQTAGSSRTTSTRVGTVPAVSPSRVSEPRLRQSEASAPKVRASNRRGDSGESRPISRQVAPPDTAPHSTDANPAELHGIVTSITPGQTRRTRGPTAAAAFTGVALLILSLVVLNPCLFVLALVGLLFLRGIVFRMLFPGGMISTWNCTLYNRERRMSESVRIMDPEGVPPEIGAYVQVDGRRRSTHIEARAIRRIADAYGHPTAGDQLIARQVPPAAVGYGLLLIGILAMLWAVSTV